MRITRSFSFVLRQVTETVFRKTTVGILAFSLLVTGVIAGQNVLLTPPTASAVTPPASCFAFSAGTITEYYTNEGNDPGQPACPKAVDIPSTIGGVVVTTIGSSAFSNDQLTSVTFPNSVTTIGQFAFVDNPINSLSLSNSLTSIGNYAFTSNQLTTLTIPSTVTSIGQQAFYHNKLTSVIFNGSVATLGSDMFLRNPITSITYNGTTYTDAIPLADACLSFSAGAVTNFRLYDMNLIKNSGIACMKRNVSIPATLSSMPVASIGASAFAENLLTAVTIPSTVTSIGDYAFSQNELTAITFPSAVTTIGSAVLQDNKLSSFTIPPTVTSIGDFAFTRNNLTSIDIPNSVTSIGDYAFHSNRLTSLALPSSVTSIGDSAFAFNRIEQTTLPNSVVSLPPGIFYFQSALVNWENLDELIYSGIPANIKQALDSIFYTRVYTADPSNPAGLQDEVNLGENELDGDEDWNDIANFGGHLINPVSVALTFKNTDGTETQPSLTYTGRLADSTYLTNYFVSQGPDMPFPVDVYNQTPAERNAQMQALQAYYRIGDSFTYTAPIVDGVTPTPGSVSFVLGATTEANNKEFAYGAANAYGKTNNSGELSNTGLSLYAVLASAGAVTLASVAGLVRYSKS